MFYYLIREVINYCPSNCDKDKNNSIWHWKTWKKEKRQKSNKFRRDFLIWFRSRIHGELNDATGNTDIVYLITTSQLTHII